MNTKKLKEDFIAIRKKAPLVHNITNFVAMNNTANALLAIGASPVMAHARREMEDIPEMSAALVLNIGTIDETFMDGMLKAGHFMHEMKRPIILDPVGAGASPYRYQVCWTLINECRPTMIRGNGSEIMALVDIDVHSKGVDSTESSADAVEAAKELARRSGAVVTISGEIDFITDGERVETIANGSPLMTKVTAMGCTATAIIGAFAAVNPDPFEASLHGMALMGVAGELAAEKSKGPGSMQVNFLDELYTITADMLVTAVKQ